MDIINLLSEERDLITDMLSHPEEHETKPVMKELDAIHERITEAVCEQALENPTVWGLDEEV